MRVLLTTHQFFPDFCSGTEVLTLGVAKELMRRGHDVAVFSGYPQVAARPEQERFDDYAFEGIRVFRFHHSFAPMGGQDRIAEMEYDNHLAGRYFSRILGAWKPELVHYFHFSRLGTGLIEIAAAAAIPGYYTPTDFWAICPTSQLLLKEGQTCGGPEPLAANCVKHIATKTRHGRFRGLVEVIPLPLISGIVGLTAKGLIPAYPMSGDVKALAGRLGVNIGRINALKAVLAPTHIMAEMLLKYGVKRSILTQVSYGIQQDSNAKVERRLPGAVLQLGFIGTLARHKGCHVLIQALRQMASQSFHLRIYGKCDDYPAYYTELERLAQGDRRIEFCGTFPNAQVGATLADLDVLVVPSVWFENAPLVVYSALAAKCPVVASNFPGIAETIQHGQNGLLFAPGDVKSLADQLDALLSDATLQPRLSAQCNSPKSMETYVDELLEIWLTEGRQQVPTVERIPDVVGHSVEAAG